MPQLRDRCGYLLDIGAHDNQARASMPGWVQWTNNTPVKAFSIPESNWLCAELPSRIAALSCGVGDAGSKESKSAVIDLGRVLWALRTAMHARQGSRYKLRKEPNPGPGSDSERVT